MKYLLFVFILALGSFKCYGQYPDITNPIGVARIYPTIDSFLKYPKFKDTIEANKSKFKDYEFSIIQVGMKIYFRSNGKWVEILPSSGSGLLPQYKQCYCCCHKQK